MRPRARATLLLDTHVFLWWREDSPRLSAKAKGVIADAPLVWVSAASAWEAAIKQSLGKLRLPEPFAQGVSDSGFGKLLITFDHVEAVSALPHIHGDPFDRLLIAQAQTEQLTLVTHDPLFADYGVDILGV